MTAGACARYISGMPKEAKTLYIIDGHAYIYAAYFVKMGQKNGWTSPAGEPTQATYIFTNTLLGLIKSRKPDMLVVAMDSKTPTFRSKIYPAYKAQRPAMPDDMPRQIDRIEQILRAMEIPALRIDGYEADDIIGTVAKNASAKGIDVFICTKDKDVLQLLDEHVRAFDIKTGREFGVERMAEEMKMTPAQFLDVLALQGDVSDNVPGVPDVGPKTALEWIQKYGSIDDLYEHADEVKGKRGESLRKSKKLAYQSKKLVTIDCSVPVEIDYEKFRVRDFDKTALAAIFDELGFSRLLAQLGVSHVQGDGAGENTDAGEPESVKTVKHDYQLIDTPESSRPFSAS